MKSDIPAILFCGGRSTRMGQPKHLLKVKEQYLWQFQIERLRTVFNEVSVSCKPDQTNDFGSERLIVDGHTDIGPMDGLLASLEHYDRQDIFVLSIDSPSVTVETMRKIASTHQNESIASVAIEKTTNRLHPLIARWNQGSRPLLKQSIETNSYSPIRLLHNSDVVKVEVDEKELFNMNEPLDFERYISNNRIL